MLRSYYPSDEEAGKAKMLSSIDSDSSDDTASDKIESNPQFDDEFFRVLSTLKSKDPSLYDGNFKVSETKTQDSWRINVPKNKKPLNLGEFERKAILDEQGFKFTDTTKTTQFWNKEAQSLGEFKQSIQVCTEDSDAEESIGGMFIKRDRNDSSISNIAENKIKVQPLEKYWSNPNLPDSEKFLRDYILHRGKETVKVLDIHSSEKTVSFEVLSKESNNNLEVDMTQCEIGSGIIENIRHPRIIHDSVRKNTKTRKQKRQEIKERKKLRKKARMLELEMLTKQKLQEKLLKIKTVSGNKNSGFGEDELVEDFDPIQHDRKMKEFFDDKYYEINEEEKPDCESDSKDASNSDSDISYSKQEKQTLEKNFACEGSRSEDVKLDLDISKKQRRNRRKLIESNKAEESQLDFSDRVRRSYKLECEDFVDDIPCHFKYVETEANDFGLSIEEILLAKDKELNKWANLKKVVQLKPPHIEKKEKKLYRFKAKNKELKQSILKSIYGETSN